MQGASALKRKLKIQSQNSYQAIYSVDGSHPLKEAAPFSYVTYQCRVRRNGSVRYFNFALAKEMGLIPKDHPEQLNKDLEKALLDTFSIRIINEYDVIHKVRIPKEDIKPNTYMATRYLQLQHPGRTGLTSGDGRSIWNGVVKAKGKVWDITSRGTGATCLSPATAINKKFFRSGDPEVSYGCGLAAFSEGLADAVFTEALHRNGVATERVLCVIQFAGDQAIVVRAGENLLRPSHLFLHLKQNKLDRLTAQLNYCIDRQIQNNGWPRYSSKHQRYDYFLKQVTETFARITAQFESEYLFCWLDWDGDNILINGGIVDFGSIRQFGLFHHEYRFDDTDRWSTTLKEQKHKARYIIQVFCQLIDYVKTGKKKELSYFHRSKTLREFDHLFRLHKQRQLLYRMGFEEKGIQHAVQQKAALKLLEDTFYYLETRKTQKGPTKVPDGKTWHAVYSMRSLLRELPRLYAENFQDIPAEKFMKLIKSSYATKKDCKLTTTLQRHFSEFQKAYRTLVEKTANALACDRTKLLRDMYTRSASINRRDRVTGDAISNIADLLHSKHRNLTQAQLQKLINYVIEDQTLKPEAQVRYRRPRLVLNQPKEQTLAQRLLSIISDTCEGL